MRFYVFAYGSLMDPDSAQATLGYAPYLLPARLTGYRTAWNVAARINEGRNLGRTALYADGKLYEGLIVPIGLEAGRDYTTNGMIFLAQEEDLALLDDREVNYDRVDVTESITWFATDAPANSFQVYTYVPKAASIEMLYGVAKSGMKAVVAKSYLDILYRAAERYEHEVPLVIPEPHWQVHDIRLQTAADS